MNRPVALFALLSVAACRPATTSAPAATPEPTPVQTVQASPGLVQGELMLAGDVEAVADIGLSPELAGRVARLFVEVGSPVKAGQTLATLDTRSAKLREAQAVAAERLAVANAESAARELKRTEGLGASIAPQALDKARDAVALSEAQLAQARAALELARDALRVSVLVSPVDGQVAAVNVEQGELWSPTAPAPMIRVIDQSAVDVRVAIPSTHIARIAEGQRAELFLDPYPGQRFDAKVFRIDPAADPRSRSFSARVRAPNPDGKLRAGMSAQVRLALPSREGALRIPRAALVEGTRGAGLFVSLAGQARWREVRPGVADREWVEILEGLANGEEVVVVGQQGLVEGASLNVSPWQPTGRGGLPGSCA